MRIYRAFQPLAKLLIPQWNYLRFTLAGAARRGQRDAGDGLLSLPRVWARGSFEKIWERGARKVRRGGLVEVGRNVRPRLGGVAAAALLISSSACGARQPTAEMIPGTGVAVEDLVFARDSGRPYDASSLNRQAMCLLRDAGQHPYSNGSLRRLGMKSRLTVHYELLSPLPAACPVRVSRSPEHVDRAQRIYETERCRFGLSLQSTTIRSVDVQLKDSSRGTFQNCMYRTGLLVEGMSGAMTLPDEKLFWANERSIFRGEQMLVGDSAPDPFFWFSELCKLPVERPLTRELVRANRNCRNRQNG